MSGVVQHEPIGEGWRTRGMRKFGLPDLLLEDWLPNNSPHWVISVVATSLVSGKRPDRRTGLLEIFADEPDVKHHLHGNAREGARTALRLNARGSGASQHHGRLLVLAFDNFSYSTLYERQMQFNIDLWKNRYVGLNDTQARELDLAIARTKSKLRGIRDRFDFLQKNGSRVFAAFRADLGIKDTREGRFEKGWTQTWGQIMKWPSDSDMTTRRWDGDPRSGGQFSRYATPIVIDGKTFEFVESDLPDSMIEDILIIHKDGRAEGGEVTELLKKLSTLIRPASRQ